MQCHPDKGGDAEEVSTEKGDKLQHCQSDHPKLFAVSEQRDTLHRTLPLGSPFPWMQFKRVGEAKAVLSDPESRNFYDTYGEDGVAFHKAWKEAKPNEMLAQMGSGGIACFCCTNCCCVLFIMLFPLLVCLKVGSGEQWLWGLVFAPLWVFDTILIGMLCVWPLLPVNVAKGDPLSNCKWDWLIQAIFFVLFQVLLCMKLDGANITWSAVIGPLLAFQAVSTGRAIYKITPGQYEHWSRVKKPGSTCGNIVWGIYLLLQELLWWALLLLVSMRLEKQIVTSWWIVLSPVFVICIFWFYASTRTAYVLNNDHEEKAYEQAFSTWKFGLTIILLLFTVLVALVAEGNDGVTIWALFGPFFVAGVCFLCAICSTSMVLFRQEADTEDGVDLPDEDSFTPRDTDPLHPGHRAHGDEHV